ncbi:cytochrome c [Bradyrhizobium sp. 190]|uniref:c-type cytochrome n=1 Tax=Bradyrhizobium sp. 190 TaxID=2782658 RepID=UPI001FF74FDD|nr:cytochrome c [Bradyrhizobium sp. 190]MCK1512562.1 cytochrome c [Bradyrhizobium sp. 190]
MAALAANTDAGMRIPFVTAASLAIIWPWLSTVAFAQQPNSADSTSSQAKTEASPNDLEGRKMFSSNCGFCHQDGGRHAGRGPKLSKSERSDEFMIERIKKGKTGSMPAYGAVFNDAQITALMAYIRGLDD